MSRALGDLLPLAVAIAVFPVPIIAVVLMVGLHRGRAKSLAFVLAWCVGLAAIGAIVLTLADGADASDDGDPATWVAVLLLALGLLLFAAAVKQWRGRPASGEAAPVPGWMLMVDDFTVAKAGGAGFALSALNPKNALLVITAAVEIAAVGLPGEPRGRSTTRLRPYRLGRCGYPTRPRRVLGGRSQEPLDTLRGWMAGNNATIMAVLFLVIGAKLVGDAVAAFFN